jgi:cycloartenol synthase
LIHGSCVECTSAVIQALALFRKNYPEHRKEEIKNCISKAGNYLESIQRSDGSWLVLKLH